MKIEPVTPRITSKPALIRLGRRHEYLPPENLLIKWRSHAGCGFNLSTCQPCVCSDTYGNIAPADCVRACVQKGVNYALVVGDKVYTLDTKDQAVSAELNKLAWAQAKVFGVTPDHTLGQKLAQAIEFLDPNPVLETG